MSPTPSHVSPLAFRKTGPVPFDTGTDGNFGIARCGFGAPFAAFPLVLVNVGGTGGAACASANASARAVSVIPNSAIRLRKYAMMLSRFLSSTAFLIQLFDLQKTNPCPARTGAVR
ncbi:hypothetical protein [Caballeronia sp. M1242]|uniref:hypothetical protein n=1 Tax=Caballeronia sp. M1242 TaxID=2814653 RepID=UPI0035300E67